ncbi:MAG: hypothetical protein JNM84_21370 [Planctomycetes bacterium]|nr:hypothetical protein [Planctomycetota bacterium]
MSPDPLHGLSACALPLGNAWLALRERPPRAALRALRARYRELTEQGEPLLVCARHHRASDGWLLPCLLAAPGAFLLHPRRRPWIVADPRSRFAGRLAPLWHRLGRVISVRQGAGLFAHIEAALGIQSKLAGGEPVLLFPAGDADDDEDEPYSYLVGRTLESMPATRVLCVRASRGALDHRVVAPTTKHSGLRAVRELALAVRDALRELDRAHS